jgi:hypothetical protein
LLKFFLPLQPTLPKFKQTFFILAASATAPAAFAAFFPFFPILSPPNDPESGLLSSFHFTLPPRVEREI